MDLGLQGPWGPTAPQLRDRYSATVFTPPSTSAAFLMSVAAGRRTVCPPRTPGPASFPDSMVPRSFPTLNVSAAAWSRSAARGQGGKCPSCLDARRLR